jgi:hypothetical protein
MALGPHQRQLLERARANAGIVSPLPRGKQEVRAARALLRRGLLIETKSQRGVLEWRVDREGEVWALAISAAGREAIGWDEPLLPTRYRGPDGAAYFHDESLTDDDPAFAAYANSSDLPECPEDADDCQGFQEQSVAYAPQISNPALLFLVSLRPDIPWQQDGVLMNFGDDDNPQADTVVTWSQMEVTVTHMMAFGMALNTSAYKPAVSSEVVAIAST